MMTDDALVPISLSIRPEANRATTSADAAINDIQPMIERDPHGAISSMYKYKY